MREFIVAGRVPQRECCNCHTVGSARLWRTCNGWRWYCPDAGDCIGVRFVRTNPNLKF